MSLRWLRDCQQYVYLLYEFTLNCASLPPPAPAGLDAGAELLMIVCWAETFLNISTLRLTNCF